MSIKNYYEHLPQSGTPKQMVVMLHGVGSNGRDLISLAPYLSRYVPDAVFISPDAPFHCDMVPPRYPDSYQWFSLQNRDPHVMLKGVENVFPLVEAFINEQAQRFDLPLDKVTLLGFSQGTMTSLHVAPRLNNKIAAVLGYSGALLWDDACTPDDLKKMPIHLIHGEADDVVPVTARELACHTLEKHGYKITGHTTRGLTHSIDEKGIESGGEFLKKVFSV